MAGRQQSRFWRHWWWAVPAGGVAFAGVVAALVAGPGGSAAPSGLVQPVPVRASSPASAGPVSSGPAHASRPRARGPAAASPAVASPGPGLTPPAAVSLPPVPRQAKDPVATWGAGPGGAALIRVSDQLGNSAQAGGLRLYLAMQQACTQLTTAVQAAKAGPPIPEPTLERRYATALATLTAAAGHCQAAISATRGGEDATARINQALIRQARQELAAGAGELYLATGRIKLAGTHH